MASVVLSVGCTGGERSAARIVADSAGIEIVTIRMVGDETDTPLRLRLDIGTADGPEAYALAQVAGAVQLSDGRIVIANGATNELRFYDEEGGFLRSVGRSGDGPGEFRNLDYLDVLPGDTMIVYDQRLRRTSVFDADGAFQASHHLADASFPYIGGMMGRLVYAAMQFVGEEEEGLGVHTSDMEVGRIDIERGLFAVFDTFPSSEESRVQYQGRSTRAFRPFGSETGVAGSADHLFVIGSSAGDICVYDGDGTLVRIIRVESPVRAVDDAAVAGWVESWMISFPAPSADVEAWWRHGFRETPAPTVAPVFRSLIADENGNVCAERYPLTWTEATVFWCFTPTGHFLRTLEVPAGRVRLAPHAYFDPPLEIGKTHVLGVWRDSLDVEHVRLFELH